MANDITNKAFNRGDWTIETWMHSSERPLPTIFTDAVTASLEEGKWHHIAAVKSTGNSKTYINGEEVLDEYTIEYEIGDYFGRQYYVAKPRGMLGNRDFDWQDMLEWCIKTFGPSEGVWHDGQRWYCNNARFYFQNENDRAWFSMRFS